MKKGMGGHHSGKMANDEWLTPPDIINTLGPFDLDPCAPIIGPFKTANNIFNVNDDGLNQKWTGRVWLNPPYGPYTGIWLKKLALHNNGIALIFARTETKMFFAHVWDHASAILFIKGRLYFHKIDGSRAKANSGAPSCLIAYGSNNADILSNCSIVGKYIRLTEAGGQGIEVIE